MSDILQKGGDYFLPHLSIDLVIIGYQEEQLKCLLLKLGDTWVLPGGYIKTQEAVDDAVVRILNERTGLQKPHFKFLSIFGAADRQFGQEFKSYLTTKGIRWQEDYWINKRFVTLAHYSLVDIATTHAVAGVFDEAVAWFPIDELPQMGMDHQDIIQTARKRLQEDIKVELLTYNLLPPSFTMPQLHRLHQHILQEKLDRSRFQKKMLATGQFERLPKLKKDSPGSNPYQYRLKRINDPES